MKRKKLTEKGRAKAEQVSAGDDGFLGKADPTLLQAVLQEMQDELAFREGSIKNQVEIPEPRPLDPYEWLKRSHINVQRWRYRMLSKFEEDPSLVESMYSRDPIKFTCHWCDVFEPRNAGHEDEGKLVRMPFILFTRQEELMQFYHACAADEGNGLVEKSRDMGATWCGVAYSIWMWRFVPGAAVGWGSATSHKLDRLGDPSSIFEKLRLGIRALPPIIRPKKFRDEDMMFNRIVNSDNGNSITGDIGDNIGRGGRTRLYFVDEAAYLEHPDAVEGALGENTRVRIYISSVSAPGTVFHRTRQAGVEWAPGGKIHKDKFNVFLMDYRDHPEKDEKWAQEKKADYESRGLGHVYAREIGRNYAAAAEGAVIHPDWFDAACNLQDKLEGRREEIMSPGKLTGGLDVGDSAGDANALTIGDGPRIVRLNEWKVRDTGVTTRKALKICERVCKVPGRDSRMMELEYDCIGLGSGIKAESNRLTEEQLMPGCVKLVPWNAGGQVLNPFENVIKNDPGSPMNIKFYANIKTQGWWHVRQLFYNTWRAVHEGMYFPIEEMICIDINAITTGEDKVHMNMVHKLRDELCQVVTKLSARMLMNIDKQPDGTQSPNLADSCIMSRWPMPGGFGFGFGILGGFGAPMSVR